MVIRRTASLLLARNVILLACCLAGAASGDQGEPVRVCADPDGLPNSNQPYDALANRDLADNIVTYQLFFDPRDPDPSRRPEKPLLDVLSGAIDAAVAWGPLVGYFAKQHPSALEVVFLNDDARLPMSFQFSMGVRKGERATES